jgi:hypothetical protein
LTWEICQAQPTNPTAHTRPENTNEIKPFDRNDLNQPSLYYVIAFWDTNRPIHSVGRLEIRTDVYPPPEGYTLQGYMNKMPFTFGGIGTLERENALDSHNMKWKIGGFAIHNMDMVQYTFETAPTIIYMYEPLFRMGIEDAMALYNNFFLNLSSNRDMSYIIYVSGVKQMLSPDFFQKYNYTLLHHCTVNRFCGLAANNIYLYKNMM